MTTTTARIPGPDELGFDLLALRERYRIEREKRLRSDVNARYRAVSRGLAYDVDDPFVTPGFMRASRVDAVDVIVTGGGFGGLVAGARPREADVAREGRDDPEREVCPRTGASGPCAGDRTPLRPASRCLLPDPPDCARMARRREALARPNGSLR